MIFVEKPLLVVVPSLDPKLWDALTSLHENWPLDRIPSLYFAALVSLFHLDQPTIQIILDKFVPDKKEEPGQDVWRILSHLSEGLEKHQKRAIDPQTLQRLASAWRYNSFGYGKEEGGMVMYNRISMCAHSCAPSCSFSFGDADAFVLRARIALCKNDELTISYLYEESLLKGTSVRQEKLQN